MADKAAETMTEKIFVSLKQTKLVATASLLKHRLFLNVRLIFFPGVIVSEAINTICRLSSPSPDGEGDGGGRDVFPVTSRRRRPFDTDGML